MSARQQAAVYGEGLARVKGYLHQQVRKGRTEVSVGEILDLIEPEGEWSRQSALPDTETSPAEVREMADSRADPITGCLPVAADSR